RNVLALVMSQGMKLVIVGIGIGIAASLLFMSLMRGLLYRVSPVDPLTIGAVTVLLVSVGVLACIIPARRAARVDPMVALRCELPQSVPPKLLFQSRKEDEDREVFDNLSFVQICRLTKGSRSKRETNNRS